MYQLPRADLRLGISASIRTSGILDAEVDNCNRSDLRLECRLGAGMPIYVLLAYEPKLAGYGQLSLLGIAVPL